MGRDRCKPCPRGCHSGQGDSSMDRSLQTSVGKALSPPPSLLTACCRLGPGLGAEGLWEELVTETGRRDGWNVETCGRVARDYR